MKRTDREESRILRFYAITDSGGQRPVNVEILRGCKEIAVFLRTSERSAMRWGAELNLPVHRSGANRGASIFAYRTELEEWQNSVGSPASLPHGAQAGCPVLTSEAGPSPKMTTTKRVQKYAALDLAVVSIATMVALVARVKRPTETSGGVIVPPSPAEGRRTPARLLTFRLESTDLGTAVLAVRAGTTATVTVPGRPTLLFTPTPSQQGVTVEITCEPGAQPPTDDRSKVSIVKLELQLGVRARLKRPYPLAIEWVGPLAQEAPR